MQITFLTLSGNITKFQLIGLVLITVDYPSSGTTTKNMLTYLCPAIYCLINTGTAPTLQPLHPQHAPHQWTQPAYGQKLQLAPIDETPKLDKTGIHFVQSFVGSLLYYTRAVDPTMLPAINEISGSQASPTQKTMSACKMLLDYAATYPLAIIRYHASDMALHTDTDAAFLVLPNARSRYAGHYILSDTHPPLPAKPNPRPNGPILTVCKTI
jgi:hypothetical protein